MPGMTRAATAGPQEEALLGRPRRAALPTAWVIGLTAVVFALAADHGTLARIQRQDDAWLRLMISGRTPAFTAIVASVTVVAAVIALVPPGRRRALWGAAAVAFSIVMGLSRAYLAAHWLSDATAGILLGTSCALVTALIADQFQRRQNRLQRAAGTQYLAGGREYV